MVGGKNETRPIMLDFHKKNSKFLLSTSIECQSRLQTTHNRVAPEIFALRSLFFFCSCDRTPKKLLIKSSSLSSWSCVCATCIKWKAKIDCNGESNTILMNTSERCSNSHYRKLFAFVLYYIIGARKRKSSVRGRLCVQCKQCA